MRANFQNTKKGDRLIFTAPEPLMHWFVDRVKNAKTLSKLKTYTVKEIDVASSSTSVTLEETGDLKYELCWFEKL